MNVFAKASCWWNYDECLFSLKGWNNIKDDLIQWSQLRRMYGYCTLCGERLTKHLRSTSVCLDSIHNSFHKSKYLSKKICKRILTSQVTIFQNLKQFRLVNLYLQGFEDWSCGHWRTYLMWWQKSRKGDNCHWFLWEERGVTNWLVIYWPFGRQRFSTSVNLTTSLMSFLQLTFKKTWTKSEYKIIIFCVLSSVLTTRSYGKISRWNMWSWLW